MQSMQSKLLSLRQKASIFFECSLHKVATGGSGALATRFKGN